jgi:hypothetical protein
MVYRDFVICVRELIKNVAHVRHMYGRKTYLALSCMKLTCYISLNIVASISGYGNFVPVFEMFFLSLLSRLFFSPIFICPFTFLYNEFFLLPPFFHIYLCQLYLLHYSVFTLSLCFNLNLPLA